MLFYHYIQNVFYNKDNMDLKIINDYTSSKDVNRFKKYLPINILHKT